MSSNSKRAGLIVKSAETSDELRQANSLIAEAHGDDVQDVLDWLRAFGEKYPGHRRDHTRLGLWEGKPRGALRINIETIRLGEARLKTGAINCVATASQGRTQAVRRALILDAFDCMSAGGCHVALGFGLSELSMRFGFTHVLPDYKLIVNARHPARALPDNNKLRPAKPGDIPAIQKLHNANDSALACSVLRSIAHTTNKWERWRGLHVLTNEQGKPVAYFAYRPRNDRLVVTEVAVDDEKASTAVMIALDRLAAKESVARVQLLMPPAHPFARYVDKHTQADEREYIEDFGGMMAFVNIGETLESMIPEWESLLAVGPLRNERVETTLWVDGRPYRIRANRGAVDVAAMPGANRISLTIHDLMEIVTGYCSMRDLLSAELRIVPPQARPLLETLFPKRQAYVWAFDRA